MRSSDMGWIRTNLDIPIIWAFPESLFRAGGVLASFQAFINVYKHYGSIAVDLDPRSKIQDYRKNFLDQLIWIQDPRSKITRKNFLDPRSGSKIQDSRKNFLDPRSGSKIQDFSRILEGSSWIQEVFPRILDLGSRPWIQEVFPKSFVLDLGSRPWIQEVFPRILDLGSRPWIQEVFPRILDLGSWIQISCYGSIAFINVCKHHLKNHSKNAKKKRSPNMLKTLYIPVKNAKM